MERFKQKILKEGVIISDHVLRLDTLLTQQVDPELIMELGQEFAKRYASDEVSKVVTIESSGISLGFATAYALGVPLVFARRKKTLVSDHDVYSERVPSFTKGMVTDIVVNKQLLSSDERVLLIDDIIANGAAIRGLIKIIEHSGAQLIGVGIAVEKAFQSGANTIREQGIRMESLVKIKSLDGNRILLE